MDVEPYDGFPPKGHARARGTVQGGFRQGKRRKGNSLLKRKPSEAARAIKFDAHDADGRILALGADTVLYTRKSEIPWWAETPR